MNVDMMNRVIRSQPFRPFDLRMNDGRVYDIRHPEFIVVFDGVVTLYSERDDATVHLEPALIASVQFAAET